MNALEPYEITKECPECGSEMKQHLEGVSSFGVGGFLCFWCENISCKFYHVMRVVTAEDIIDNDTGEMIK